MTLEDIKKPKLWQLTKWKQYHRYLNLCRTLTQQPEGRQPFYYALRISEALSLETKLRLKEDECYFSNFLTKEEVNASID